MDVFDRQRLIDMLRERQEQQAITDRATVLISALRLLKETAAAGLRSLRIEGGMGVSTEDLEQAATAFRVRLAYESSIVLAPVLDVNRLDSLSQPTLVRQLKAGMAAGVEAIGHGAPTGYISDHLLGIPVVANEELCLTYLRAVAADEPFSAFMGYFHVLEYAMEEAWFEDLSDRVATAGGKLLRPADGIRTAASEAASTSDATTKTSSSVSCEGCTRSLSAASTSTASPPTSDATWTVRSTTSRKAS